MEALDERLAALPERISSRVLTWAELRPDAPALGDGNRAWSYRDFADAVHWARDWMTSLGVRAGDRVMIVNENGLALAALIMAASECLAWAAIVNARLSPREIDQIRTHSGARRVFYTTADSADARRHAERHEATDTDAGPLGRLAIGALGDALPEPVPASPAERVAVLIYTSGTTGNPKAVMLTHRNLLFIAAVSGGLRGLGPGDRLYGVLPIAHVFGLASTFLGAVHAGAMVRLSPRFDPAQTLAALTGDRLTVLQGVPAMYARLLEHLDGSGHQGPPAPTLRYLSAGGSPLDPALKAAVERTFGLPLHNGYGLTESAPTVSQTRMDAPRPDCSAGPLLPGVEARLLGPDHAPVAEGSVGELWIRGPNVMKGYYRAPQETAAAIDRDGWLNTRDLARFADGCLWIEGRTRELIIRSGFNVYPAEVEAVLSAHPDVTQAAVVGRKTAGNEEVVAFVQLRPGAGADTATLAAFAAERLAAYKRPVEIVILKELPASSTGKIMKHQLAELAQGDGPMETNIAGTAKRP